MTAINSLIKGTPLLPILQPTSISEALYAAEAVLKSGLYNLEIVRRTPCAGEALEAIRKRFPELILALGTVTNQAHIDEAKDRGAHFIVTPTTSQTLLTSLKMADIPYLPGVSSPSEILTVKEFGIKEMKFFPASVFGGTRFIKAMGSIFSDVSFCPTGGVNAGNLQEYISLHNVFAVGGSWMLSDALIAQKDWDSITKACIEASQILTEEAA